MTEDQKAKSLLMALQEIWSRDEMIENLNKEILDMKIYIEKLEKENDELRRFKKKWE